MNLTTYQQTSCESCLPVCLLSLGGIEITREKELKLLFDGLAGLKDSYAFGVLEAFVKTYNKKIDLFVDNKFFTNLLIEKSNSSQIAIIHKPVNLEFETPFVVYLDSQILGGYSHAPHFIIVEKIAGDICTIIDPWEGKRKRLSKEKLTAAISSLKYYLKYCPILIKLISSEV